MRPCAPVSALERLNRHPLAPAVSAGPLVMSLPGRQRPGAARAADHHWVSETRPFLSQPAARLATLRSSFACLSLRRCCPASASRASSPPACATVCVCDTPCPIHSMMSAYGSGWQPGSYPGLVEKLLWKSAACEGFFLLRCGAAIAESIDAIADASYACR
jgi:hypothetical protein